MRASLRWLRELVPELLQHAPQATAAALTSLGLEVEGIEERGRNVEGVLIARVVSVRPHPHAEKLRLVTIRAGSRQEEVVCGAPNVPPPGFAVCWAPPGAHVPGLGRLAAKEVRGIVSPGMLCSAGELGLDLVGDGILVLSPTQKDGVDADEALMLRDDLFEVNVTPNRADALSHLGLARELAAFHGTALVRPEIRPPSSDAFATPSVVLAPASGCLRYQAQFFTAVTVEPSPAWMRVRLSACGVRPISNLVDVTNYVLLESGHPLHAFDLDKVDGDVVIRRATAGEGLTTLDGEERALVEGDVVIADARGPIAVAGVMGGARTEVTAQTRRVLLEAATFEPRSVRRTSKRLGLSSEASYRFERGVDAEGVPYAAARAATLLETLAPSTRRAPAAVDLYPRPEVASPIKLSASRLARVTGQTIPMDEAAQALKRLEGVKVEIVTGPSGPKLEIMAPSYRPDLTLPEDLIEEILRLSGRYATPSDPFRITGNTQPEPNPQGAPDRARTCLAGCGLSEVATWGFVPRASLAALTIDPGDDGLSRGFVVKNPISSAYELMRTSLIPGLIEVTCRNLARGMRDVALFEVGPVIRRGPDGEPVQTEKVSGLICGRRPLWLRDGGAVDFYDLRGIVDTLAETFGAADAAVAPAPAPGFLHPGVAGRLFAHGQVVGLLGELHPVVRRRLGLDVEAFVFELSLDGLAVGGSAVKAEAPPRFPAVTRDVSFWIAEEILAADMKGAFVRVGEGLLRAVSVLEDFRDSRYTPPGKKGMLWTLTYRADDRTLTDPEVDAAHGRVVAALRAAHVVEVR